jgi:hypothetical protein
MLCPFPQALDKLLYLVQNKRADDAYMVEFLDAFLNGLCVLGLERDTAYILRRQFELVGSLSQNASDAMRLFEGQLIEHDGALGAELGGLGNLFRSLVLGGEVFAGEHLEFTALEGSLQRELSILGQSFMQISAADDIAFAAERSVNRVASLICLAAVSDWISAGIVSDFLGPRHFLAATARLYSFRPQLTDLRPDFIQHTLNDDEVTDFALWYLASYFSRNEPLGPFQRRLVGTLLSRASLPKLDVVESAFFG